MRKFTIPALAASTAAIAVASIATPAFAQSTGAVEFEKVIVVTGKTNKSLAGVELPATSKAKQVLDQSFISQALPGQSINDTIGMIPGLPASTPTRSVRRAASCISAASTTAVSRKPSTACR
jgi:iron complex outermembrane receptor protein